MKSVSALTAVVFLLLVAVQAGAASDKKHFPGIFLGYTNANSHTDFTYGIEYEYKFNKEWGAGLVYEETNDAKKGKGITVKVASLFYHPYGNWRLGLGAGEEKIGGDAPYTKDLIRLSGSYEYHIGDFGIAPTFAVDFIDGDEAYVLGVAILRPF